MELIQAVGFVTGVMMSCLTRSSKVVLRMSTALGHTVENAEGDLCLDQVRCGMHFCVGFVQSAII